MASKKSSCLEMDAAYRRFESEQFDEIEEAEILALLQSSDAESSSDDELAPPPKKKSCLTAPRVIHRYGKLQPILLTLLKALAFLLYPMHSKREE